MIALAVALVAGVVVYRWRSQGATSSAAIPRSAHARDLAGAAYRPPRPPPSVPPSPSTVPANDVPTCTAAMLRATFTGFEQQSESFTEGEIVVVDTGSQPCALQGTPGLAFRDGNGRRLPVQTNPRNFDGQPPVLVILGRPTPATGAFSLVGAYDAERAGTNDCPELSPPPTVAVLTLPGQPEGLTVGQTLEGGTSGFQQLRTCGAPVDVLSFEPFPATA